MPRRKLSQKPQAKWARRQVKLGRCRICGQKRTKYAQLCDFHQGQFNLYMKGWRKHRKEIFNAIKEYRNARKEQLNVVTQNS